MEHDRLVLKGYREEREDWRLVKEEPESFRQHETNKLSLA